MHYLNASFILVLLFFSNITHASFDWGGSGGNCSGSGNFQQQIKSNDVIEVGEIPSGKEGVSIQLTSDNDVDIQLYDKSTGDKIIVWPDGILSGNSKQTTNYKGMNIEWSGYNGDGINYGHEYINISGVTNRTLVMKAFGYQAGFANVDYSWTGTQGCSEDSRNAESGSGTFQQQILHQAVVTVGDIPVGIDNLSIQLISDKDVDIQLYDKDNDVEIIAWPNGILNGSSKQTTNYKGMNIEWSGYNGDGSGLGHEYIEISGTTTQNLTMKAFGYQAGYATVNYSWGSGTNSDNDLMDSFMDAIGKKKIKWDNGFCSVNWGYVLPPHEWKHIDVRNSSSGGRDFFNQCSTDANGNPCIRIYTFGNYFDDKECITFHPPTLEEIKHYPSSKRVELQGGKTFYYSSYAADENYACVFRLKKYDDRVDVEDIKLLLP